MDNGLVSTHSSLYLPIMVYYLLASDCKGWPLADVQDIFGKTCPFLDDKPKVFLIDACRGGLPPSISNGNGNGDEARGQFVRNSSAGFYTHYATSENYRAFGDKRTGGHLIKAVYDYYLDRFKRGKSVKLTEAGSEINNRVKVLSAYKQASEASNKLDFHVNIKLKYHK